MRTMLKLQNFAIISGAIVLVLAVCIAVPLAINYRIELEREENTVYTTAEVVSIGEKGIQVSYEGNYGETKTANIQTNMVYSIGDVVPVAVYCGRVRLDDVASRT